VLTDGQQTDGQQTDGRPDGIPENIMASLRIVGGGIKCPVYDFSRSEKKQIVINKQGLSLSPLCLKNNRMLARAN